MSTNAVTITQVTRHCLNYSCHQMLFKLIMTPDAV